MLKRYLAKLNFKPWLPSIATLLLLCNCHSKGKEDAAGQTSPIAIPGSAMLQGLPTNPSKAQTLSVTLTGPSLMGYQYALQSDSTLCNNAKLSALKKADDIILDDLGEDTTKTLCIIAFTADGNDKKASSFSYTWLKDATPPTIEFMSAAGFGPYSQTGSKFSIPLKISDATSAITSAIISISDGETCLNLAMTAFGAPCPTYTQAIKIANESYQISIPNALLKDAQNYTITAHAGDKAGNIQSESSPFQFVWDTTAPVAVPTLTASTQQQSISLSWPAIADATQYLVVRKAWAPVSAIPAPGASSSLGFPLGNDNFVACVTTQTDCVDSGLDAFTWYYYQVIAYDRAENRNSTGARASAQTKTEARFQGLTRISLASPNRTVAAEWQAFDPNQTGSITYGIFKSDSPSEQIYASPSATTVGTESISYVENGTSDNLYATAKQWKADGVLDSNKRELRLKLAPGIHHKLTSSGRYLGQDPLNQTFLSSVWAIAVDPFGNLVFGGAPGRLNVICKESLQAYYCKNRLLDKIYSFAGTDGSDDGSDAGLGSATATGEPYGITFDNYGNMFLADSTNFRVRAYCYNPGAPGFCNSKTIGYAFHLAGTGSSVDGLDDSVAKTSGIGTPYGVSVDSQGNVYVADNTFRKIRLICATNLLSPCAGKVVGNIYNLIGTGIAGDASDNIPALAANLGNIGAQAIDSLGNLYFSDLTYGRIRVLCQTTTGTDHFCSGKIVNNTYRVSGTGTLGDGLNNIAATTAAVSAVNGMAVSPSGNVYFTDNSATGNRIRALCFNVSQDYYCNGRTSGNSYRISGTGASTDGASNTLAVSVAIGSPRGLAIDSVGNMIFSDATNRRIRLHCSASGKVCDGKLPDYHYQLAGVGAASLGWNLNAFLTPVGLPQGLAEDPFGNIFFADATNFVARVICYDVSHAGFCLNKTLGHSYVIAGNAVTGNAVDNVLALANSIGTITGVEVDSDGNLYLADNTNRTIRLVCGTITGACSGKASGYMYRYIGNTTAIDTPDNTPGVSAGLGQPADISLDTQGNIWIADAQYFRVRLYCRNLSGLCVGKAIGNLYRILGTGITGNALDAATGASSALGTLTSIDVDPWNNLILGDSSNFFVRVYCSNSSGGFCASKVSAAGKIYRALGTGITGDAISDTSAGTSAISAMNAVQSDDKGNIYVAESTNRRIRVLCVDNLVGFCSALTVNNSYRMFGSGVAGDASSGVSGASAKIDTPSRDSLLFTANGRHLIYGGGGTPAGLGSIRVFLGYK